MRASSALGRVALALALALAGCERPAATQVIVVVDAEPGVIADAPRLSLLVRGGDALGSAIDAERLSLDLRPGDTDPAYPFRVAIAPRDGDVERVYEITATAQGEDRSYVAQARAISGFVPGRTIEVRLVLEDACRAQRCADDETCRAGVCVSAFVDVADAGIDAGSRLDAAVDLPDAEMADAEMPLDAPMDGAVPDDDATIPLDAPMDDGGTAGDAGSDGGVCVAVPEVCNTLDDDCDGTADDGVCVPCPAGYAGTDDDCEYDVVTLSALVPSSGMLAPSFTSSTLAYTLDLPTSTAMVSMIPSVAEPTLAVIRVEGVVVASGALSAAAALTPGTPRTLRITVTAESGRVGTYMVVARRAAVVQVVAGQQHTCVRMADGTVRCWGGNASGQLGLGTTANRATPAVVPGLTGVAEITAGVAHTCARMMDSSVRCWGWNNHGQLGDGTTTDRTSPTAVSIGGVAMISAGRQHTCAAMLDGTARCWGGSMYGQVGDGAMIDRLTPTTVMGLSTVVEVSAGDQSCARLMDGTVSCWGYNGQGQLGDGTMINRAVPGPVSILTDATDLDVSEGSHACAVDAGSARCWGYNMYGQLGDGTLTTRSTPTVATGLSAVVEVGAGGNHTCARVSGGTMSCWGINYDGQLGDGSTGPGATSPRAVPGLTGVVEIATGYAFTCARLSDARLMCWGDNASGQLGDGSMTDRPSPGVVTGL